jgi:predicted O-methyltransferase YrrM
MTVNGVGGIRRLVSRARKRRDLDWVERNIQTHTTAREREALYDLASGSGEPRNLLEIGSYLGASSFCLAAGMSHGGGGRLFCVDTWQNETMPDGSRDTFAEFGANTSRYRDFIVTVRKRSEALLPSDISGRISLAFIDGDHSYDSVRGDVETIKPFLAEDAIVAFHDSRYFPGVSKAIGECLSLDGWQLLGAVDNLAWLKPASNGRTLFDFDQAGIRVDRQ